MAITGAIKFFTQSYSLFSRGATAVASSGVAAQDYILSMRKEFRWESVGSNDATTETIVVTLPNPQTINRIFLVGHNLKDFDVTYDAIPTNFTNVVGLDGPVVGGIIETVFDKDTAYYEFDPVTTDTFTITMNTTQIPNEEKFLTIFVATEELATLNGFPEIRPTVDNNERTTEVLSGRKLVQKWFQITGYKLRYDTYSNPYDNEVFFQLYSRYKPFLVWVCGGLFDDGVQCIYSYQQAGYRLEDLIQVQTIGPFSWDYYKSITKLGIRSELTLVECVDG